MKVGQYTRVVKYSICNESHEAAICRIFADVPHVVNAPELVLQRKHEEWGEFIDVQKNKSIPDCCVLNVVLHSLSFLSLMNMYGITSLLNRILCQEISLVNHPFL